MDNRPSCLEINDFLLQVRQAIDSGNCGFASRMKCMQFLAKIGYMPEDIFDDIYNLQDTDYFSGPEMDHNPSYKDCVWVFKKNICGYKTYIKIKLIEEENSKLWCFAFHEDRPNY